MQTDTRPLTEPNHILTAAALGLIAISIVTTAHEALGHGGACLIAGGRVMLLTSSLFHCATPSPLIDPAGPLTNLALGITAMVAARYVRAPLVRLLLILIGAFSGFWESGYLILAMLEQKGDLYLALSHIQGPPSDVMRAAFALIGAGLYIATALITSRSLQAFGAQAQIIARSAWIGATVGAGLAASLFLMRGTDFGPQNLTDALMESGLASVIMWAMPLRGTETTDAVTPLKGNRILIIIALGVFGLFAATLGYGFVP